MARLGVEATGAGSRSVWSYGRKVAVRHSGSCAPRWCFPPRFNHRSEQWAHVNHRTKGPSATRACCKHSRVPPRTLDQPSRLAQRWLLHDFMPSRISTAESANRRRSQRIAEGKQAAQGAERSDQKRHFSADWHRRKKLDHQHEAQAARWHSCV